MILRDRAFSIACARAVLMGQSVSRGPDSDLGGRIFIYSLGDRRFDNPARWVKISHISTYAGPPE